MTEPSIETRALRADELRAASTLFRASLHHRPVTDEVWARRGRSYEDGRVLGAFRGDTLVGTALSSGGQLAVPGGALLPMAMVTAVGVRADQTRRGVLRALMGAQLAGITEPVATLRASESAIYGRFGYGVATRARTVRIDRRRAVFRPGVPAGGSVRLVPIEQAWDALPALYDEVSRRRPGWAARPDGWWDTTRTWQAEQQALVLVAMHSGPDGDDGFAVYEVRRDRERDRTTLELMDLFAADDRVWAALWRFLLGVDLVDEVRGSFRPLDEPVEELFVDRRVVATTEIEDETWLRLADVPAALAARAFGEFAAASPVVIEVRDGLLPANAGRYLLGDGPARPVDEPAGLTMDVDVLGQLYLGDVAPSALAAVGRVEVAKSDALPAADRLFAVDGSPWCGTFF